MDSCAAYLHSLVPLRRERLQAILTAAQTALPGAILSLKYRMPTLEYHGQWIGCASELRQLALYLNSPCGLDSFLLRHPELAHQGTTVYFSDYDAIPLADLSDLVAQRFGRSAAI